MRNLSHVVVVGQDVLAGHHVPYSGMRHYVGWNLVVVVQHIVAEMWGIAEGIVVRAHMTAGQLRAALLTLEAVGRQVGPCLMTKLNEYSSGEEYGLTVRDSELNSEEGMGGGRREMGKG